MTAGDNAASPASESAETIPHTSAPESSSPTRDEEDGASTSVTVWSVQNDKLSLGKTASAHRVVGIPAACCFELMVETKRAFPLGRVECEMAVVDGRGDIVHRDNCVLTSRTQRTCLAFCTPAGTDGDGGAGGLHELRVYTRLRNGLFGPFSVNLSLAWVSMTTTARDGSRLNAAGARRRFHRRHTIEDTDYNLDDSIRRLSLTSPYNGFARSAGMTIPFLTLVSMHPRTLTAIARILGIKIAIGRGAADIDLDYHQAAWEIISVPRQGLQERVTHRHEQIFFGSTMDWYQVIRRSLRSKRGAPVLPKLDGSVRNRLCAQPRNRSVQNAELSIADAFSPSGLPYSNVTSTPSRDAPASGVTVGMSSASSLIASTPIASSLSRAGFDATVASPTVQLLAHVTTVELEAHDAADERAWRTMETAARRKAGLGGHVTWMYVAFPADRASNAGSYRFSSYNPDGVLTQRIVLSGESGEVPARTAAELATPCENGEHVPVATHIENVPDDSCNGGGVLRGGRSRSRAASAVRAGDWPPINPMRRTIVTSGEAAAVLARNLRAGSLPSVGGGREMKTTHSTKWRIGRWAARRVRRRAVNLVPSLATKALSAKVSWIALPIWVARRMLARMRPTPEVALDVVALIVCGYLVL